MFAAGPISLPRLLRKPLEAASRVSLLVEGDPTVSFLEPAGDPALLLHDSISWQIFKNPVALFVGGVAAVLLELAEPSVRTGVWEHSRFRTEPLIRMRRTGLAALTAVYAARSVSQKAIARVVRIHEAIAGTTPAGLKYRANDPELLAWVHATAAFSFFQAYSRYVRPQSRHHFDLYCREGVPVAALFGATGVPYSGHEMAALFDAKRNQLEQSPIVFEFLNIMHGTPILPILLRPFQRVLVRAAIDVLPPWVRQRLGLGRAWEITRMEIALVENVGRIADQLLVRSSPAVQACVRLGLPEHFLYQPAVIELNT